MGDRDRVRTAYEEAVTDPGASETKRMIEAAEEYIKLYPPTD